MATSPSRGRKPGAPHRRPSPDVAQARADRRRCGQLLAGLGRHEAGPRQTGRYPAERRPTSPPSQTQTIVTGVLAPEGSRRPFRDTVEIGKSPNDGLSRSSSRAGQNCRFARFCWRARWNSNARGALAMQIGPTGFDIAALFGSPANVRGSETRPMARSTWFGARLRQTRLRSPRKRAASPRRLRPLKPSVD